MNEYTVTWMFALMYSRSFTIFANNEQDARKDAEAFLWNTHQYPANTIINIAKV